MNKTLIIVGALIVATGIFAFMVPKPPTPARPVVQSERKWDNDRVIEETKKCEAAGLKAERIYNGWTYETSRINCIPKE
jgi:hypothetical protein